VRLRIGTGEQIKMSERINDDGPVFPIPPGTIMPDGRERTLFGLSGMTLRDWFAGMAMLGRLSNSKVTKLKKGASRLTDEERNKLQAYVAERAYGYADAMIAEMEKGKPSAETNTPS
jgi:hypothetical protein